MAPEDLRELGRLPVSHGAGHDLHRQRACQQQLRGALHPGSLELVAEAGAAHLPECPLELAAARRDLVGHPGEGQVCLPMPPTDDLHGLLIEIAPALHRGCPHTVEYGRSPRMDHMAAIS